MRSWATYYRPTKLDEVCGQSAIKKILQQQLSTKKISHCYLFCGPSGCGKTTVARIFANEINEGHGSPIEIDAASNNGVENIRNIIKDAQERSIDSEYKVYILDEAHALTAASWQCLLKCIEEPPTHTIFIFCTTEAQKVPVTVQGRTMRFNFSKVPTSEIRQRLYSIMSAEGLHRGSETADTVDYISKLADGCMREAITLLEKVVAFSNDCDMKSAMTALGNIPYEQWCDLTNALIDGKEATVIEIVEDIFQNANISTFVDQYISFIFDVSKYALFGNCDMLKIPNGYKDALETLVKINEPTKYYAYVVDRLLALRNAVKAATNVKTLIEIYLLKIARMEL